MRRDRALSKVIKAIKNPRLALRILHKRIISTYNRSKAKRSATRNGGRLDLGEHVRFHQKTLFTGRGSTRIG